MLKTAFLSLALLLNTALSAYGAEAPCTNPEDLNFNIIVCEGYTAAETVLSPDGERTAYLASKNGKWHVFFNGKKGKPYDQIKDIAISPNGKRVAYSAQKGMKEYLVINEKESKPYSTVCNPTFSPDSRIAAAEASINGKYFVVFGMKESPRYDMSVMPPAFSPDSKRIFYMLQDYKNGKTIAFIADAQTGMIKKKNLYDNIGAVSFSSDGKRFAYSAMKKNEGWFIVRGGFSGGEDKETPVDSQPDRIIFSPDMRHMAYQMEGGRSLMITDMNMFKKEGLYDEEGIFEPSFTENGKFIVYGTKSESGPEHGMVWNVKKIQ